MGIPDPTIDPITGLPILDTSPIVQQIPLGRQTVDYAGWNATAQPTRTPLYPDDVIPVFANVQGQHPQTGNAQNVTTDGEGRLNVHTFPEGGGGGGATTAKLTPFSVFGSGSIGFGPWRIDYTTGFKLYKIAWSLGIPDGFLTGNESQNMRWIMAHDNDDSNGFDVAYDIVNNSTSDNNTRYLMIGETVFNPLMDVLNLFFDPPVAQTVDLYLDFSGSPRPSAFGQFIVWFLDA
jgi:hypothetical protein